MSSTDSPRFSVVIAAYNVSAYIEETLESVLSQQHPSFEVVLVDDGSTDDTLSIVERIASADPRLRVFTKENGGCASAQNVAIAEARGEFIGIIGADDLYTPEYLVRTDAFIASHPDFDIYACNGYNLFPDGTRRLYFRDARHAEVTELTLEDWFPRCPIFGMCVYRKSVWESVGGYRTDLRNAEDYDYYLRAMVSGARMIHNPEPLALYRRHETSKSSNRVKAARAVLTILEEIAEASSLTDEQRRVLDGVIGMRRAAIGRREMEQRFLDGDFSGARGAYLASRDGYASKRKFLMMLPVVMVSPRMYAEMVLRRRGMAS